VYRASAAYAAGFCGSSTNSIRSPDVGILSIHRPALRKLLRFHKNAKSSMIVPAMLSGGICGGGPDELTGTGYKLDAFLQAIEPGVILETVRTGASGIGRGERILRV
jgi:hypothetical protein